MLCVVWKKIRQFLYFLIILYWLWYPLKVLTITLTIKNELISILLQIYLLSCALKGNLKHVNVSWVKKNDIFFYHVKSLKTLRTQEVAALRSSLGRESQRMFKESSLSFFSMGLFHTAGNCPCEMHFYSSKYSGETFGISMRAV